MICTTGHAPAELRYDGAIPDGVLDDERNRLPDHEALTTSLAQLHANLSECDAVRRREAYQDLLAAREALRVAARDLRNARRRLRASGWAMRHHAALARGYLAELMPRAGH